MGGTMLYGDDLRTKLISAKVIHANLSTSCRQQELDHHYERRTGVDSVVEGVDVGQVVIADVRHWRVWADGLFLGSIRRWLLGDFARARSVVGGSHSCV